MIKIQIKNRFTGSIIFESKKENNTVSKAVKDYIEQEISKGLSYADLSNADLSNADLRNTDLSSADLSYANLSNADLRNTDLSYADLSNADLRNTDLRNTDLSYADLSYANLRNTDLSSADLSNAKNTENSNLPIFCKWSHSNRGGLIQIGCETKTIKEWNKFFASNEVIETERSTKEFKRIEAVFRAYEAYINHLKK
jgi:hypothetical protein